MVSVGRVAMTDRIPGAKTTGAQRLLAGRAGTGVIEFVEGLLGFPEFRSYRIEETASGRPFKWLRAVDEDGPEFAVLDPRYFRPDYSPPLPAEDLRALRLDDPGQAEVYVLVTVPDDPAEMTANLRGPVVINGRLGVGKQVVLLSGEFSARCRILDEMRSRAV